MNTKVFADESRAAWMPWAFMSLAVAAAIFACFDALVSMTNFWFTKDEYSHGPLVPLIALFLIAQRLPKLEMRAQERMLNQQGAVIGTLVTALAVVVFVAAELGALYIVQQYAFLLLVYGVVLSAVGLKNFWRLAAPMALLFFMVPLPSFLYASLSNLLQLWSSQLGVALIRLFDISVLLNGNVIDLGHFQLMVAEACNGLRYLFPLVTVAFMVAAFYQGAIWQRILIFLSSLPIAVLMNGLRVGVIGVTVEYWGISMAEGFLHDFEGWAMFMLSFAVLLLEVFLLARWCGVSNSLGGALDMSLQPLRWPAFPMNSPVIASLGLVALTLGLGFLLPERAEVIPSRETFASFPDRLGEFVGERRAVDPVALEVLKLDDYLMSDFRDDGGRVANFYVSWYDSQRKEAAAAAHSPRACLPGAGWEIVELQDVEVRLRNGVGHPLRRVLLRKGNEHQLAYYYFDQRGRVITSELAAKWYLFVDSALRQRTDGAMVRLMTRVDPTAPVAADAMLTALLSRAVEALPAYVPH